MTAMGRTGYYPGWREFVAHFRYVHASFRVRDLPGAVLLFAAVIVTNTLAHLFVTVTVAGFPSISPGQAFIPVAILFCTFSPWAEESAKRFANRRGTGSTYVVGSSWVEFLLYAAGLASPATLSHGPLVWGVILAARLPAVGMHVYTQQVQLVDLPPSRPSEDDRSGFRRAVAIHSGANAVFMSAGTILAIVVAAG